jgi:O-methyltransferase
MVSIGKTKESLQAEFERVHTSVECVHEPGEVWSFAEYLLEANVTGCIVEMGCYKGGGSAKLSLLASCLQKELHIFDSFKGLPQHQEKHITNIFGQAVTFTQGEYASALEQTCNNIKQYGVIDVCHFWEGWFHETFPNFNESVAGAYIDVDLVGSVKECFLKMYHLIVPGGIIACHDGHLPLVLNMLADKNFWEQELGCNMPVIDGLYKRKLIKIIKE